jgi:hypothetical protein
MPPSLQPFDCIAHVATPSAGQPLEKIKDILAVNQRDDKKADGKE